MTSLTPAYPKTFSYYHPIHVRYADLDTLLHVNNVTIMQYVESARIGYYRAAGIWDGSMTGGFGMVVASVHIDFLVSIQFSDEVRLAFGHPTLALEHAVRVPGGKRGWRNCLLPAERW